MACERPIRRHQWGTARDIKLFHEAVDRAVYIRFKRVQREGALRLARQACVHQDANMSDCATMTDAQFRTAFNLIPITR